MVHIGRGLARASVLWMTLAMCMTIAGPAWAQPAESVVYVVQVSGVIDPPVARYIVDRLARANDAGAQAVILQLDTPGGLQVINAEVAEAVHRSAVPIVAWIAPRDARAASTGALLVAAAHRAYAADSTTLGPVTPATLGSDASELEERAVVRLYESLSAGAQQASAATPAGAMDPNVVNGEVSSLRDLLQTIDGATVETEEGTTTLETWDETAGAPSVTIRFAQMDPIQRLLHAVTEPKIALLLFLAGLFGLIFELYNPGIGLAAIVGAGALALGIYALSVLPTNWVALLVISAAIGFMLIDLHAAALGPASGLGILGLVAGSAFLFSGAPPPLQLSPIAIGAAVVVTIVFFVSVMTAALRVRLRRPVSDDAGIVGTVGEATTDIAPEGTVLTKGTLWRARTMETGIAAGAKVEVKATEGLVLLVEPLHGEDGEPEA